MNMEDILYYMDTLYVLIAALLVLTMQLGFGLLETGTLRAKNAGHVAVKQIISLSVAALAFWAVGFGLSFGDGTTWFGTEGFFLSGSFTSLDWANVSIDIKFLFQLSFVAVSLAIAWGGFAERAKLSAYVLFGIFFVAILYPIVARSVWAGGMLGSMGMQDFAGSAVVHLQGGMAALMATIILKPRRKTESLAGHNHVLTVVGGLVLWLCWFGFNAGSTMSVADGFFGYVALTTMLATAAGALGALAIVMLHRRTADIPTIVNGVLGALVAITAACAFVEPWAAVVIGALASIATYGTSILMAKYVDDPLCAFSVHGVAGIIGTLALGFFASPRLVEITGIGSAGLFYGGGLTQLGVQTLGVLIAMVIAGGGSYAFLKLLDVTIGLRVTEEQEDVGLDIAEHGVSAYGEVEEATEKPGRLPKILGSSVSVMSPKK
ncbi:ammonium transporter [Exiguobacterium aestuarii]|uniref:Ammonium transporter n=1 Tax=Exiguobacterium aestuarii TaxID=273527 RepID=A0ABW2PM51_9BACL|nr:MULTISPECIES: ammonium transporter [Exiguobacterium]MCT4785069.1 ammonium transporter [Exiguobacterium aestuarii]